MLTNPNGYQKWTGIKLKSQIYISVLPLKI